MEDKSKQGGTYLEKWRGDERRKDPWLWMALDGVGSRRDRVSLVFTTSAYKWPRDCFYTQGVGVGLVSSYSGIRLDN